jgi:hypothetical protein
MDKKGPLDFYYLNQNTISGVNKKMGCFMYLLEKGDVFRR